MPLPDWRIRQLALNHGMIKPFFEQRLSSYGYDITLDRVFKIPRDTFREPTIIDPKNMNPQYFEDYEGDYCLIPPHGFVLGQSVEYFSIPRNLIGICFGRSSYARAGIVVNVTPLEAEWRGRLTIEISNANPHYAKIYANEGICQVVFFQCDEICSRSYPQRSKKYQYQTGIWLSRL